MFSFRRHGVLEGDDPMHMPQHLSKLEEEASRQHIFLYSFRSTAIMHIIAHVMATVRGSLRNSLYDFYNDIFGGSGDGFCFEFVSLENIVRQNNIQARALKQKQSQQHTSSTNKNPKNPEQKKAKSPKQKKAKSPEQKKTKSPQSTPATICLTNLPTRICYFSNIDDVVLDDRTLYVPFSSVYPAADAISKCTIGGVSNLVFYQATAADTHPLVFSDKHRPENSKAMKMVNGWSKKSTCERLLVLFISNNEKFVCRQDGYDDIRLARQYVWRRKSSDHYLSPR
jgi:hypothetical protein